MCDRPPLKSVLAGQRGAGHTFRTCLIWQVEAAVETSGSKPQPPWVPYYVMHKILAGLLSHFEVAAVVVMAAVVMAALVVALMAVVAQLWGSKEALDVALRLATHLRRRVDAMVRRGEDVWLDFINQEVSVSSSGPSSSNPFGLSVHLTAGRWHV